jgi:dipeptidyl aminopeptidase/acylaminoacyl peptidase
MALTATRPAATTALRVGAMLLAVWVLCPARSAGQIPSDSLLPAARADALTGLYVLDDGRLVHVVNLADQVGGRSVLSVTEYATGRARALNPLADGAFEAGSGWFEHGTAAFRIRFVETLRPAPALTWTEGGRVVHGRRAPLVERDVTITNGDVRLAGTLVLPPGRGPHPALVMVPGSGPETRRIPRYVGDLLAWHGIAVLVTDKRGTGGSTGSWNGLSHAAWAGDVVAQLDWLRRQPEVDSTRLGLYGNSEGGFVVPWVAMRRPDVRFLVCRVCPGLPGPTVMVDIQTGVLRREGVPEGEVELAMGLYERMMRYALERSGYDSLVEYAARYEERPWRTRYAPRQIPARDAPYWDTYRDMLGDDPRAAYARLRIPVLVILGERDDRLLVARHRAAFDSLARRGVPLTLWVIPAASHGLMLGPRNSAGYPPGLHDRIVRWVTGAAGVRD